MTTLAEALSHGQGIERPFRCEAHDDHQASASVNVLKQVWFCHACHSHGSVDSKVAPKEEDLLAMMAPEKTGRVYRQAFLELYQEPSYWLTRFPAWLCHTMGLGEDPFTGDATFPVHTAGGRLAGVGRRNLFEQGGAIGSRYLYPRNWSASSALFGSNGRWRQHDVVALVEGAADATAVWGVGCPAFAVYGAGVHLPQIELIARMQPKLILLGFDMDDAGEQAVTRSFRDLPAIAPMVRVKWPRTHKDPAATPAERRLHVLEEAVGRSGYGKDVSPSWTAWRSQAQRAYRRAQEEAV